MPSLKLTVRPGKLSIPKGNNRLPTIHFQVLLVSGATVSGRVYCNCFFASNLLKSIGLFLTSNINSIHYRQTKRCCLVLVCAPTAAFVQYRYPESFIVGFEPSKMFKRFFFSTKKRGSVWFHGPHLSRCFFFPIAKFWDFSLSCWWFGIQNNSPSKYNIEPLPMICLEPLHSKYVHWFMYKNHL